MELSSTKKVCYSFNQLILITLQPLQFILHCSETNIVACWKHGVLSKLQSHNQKPYIHAEVNELSIACAQHRVKSGQLFLQWNSTA